MLNKPNKQGKNMMNSIKNQIKSINNTDKVVLIDSN